MEAIRKSHNQQDYRYRDKLTVFGVFFMFWKLALGLILFLVGIAATQVIGWRAVKAAPAKRADFRVPRPDDTR
jgi:hypothetical protein